MSEKVKYIRILQNDGTYSSPIAIASSDIYVQCFNGTVTLDQVLQDITNFSDIVSPFDAQNAYKIGDYVSYEKDIYRFKANHSPGTAWNNNLVKKVVLSSDLKDMIQISANQPTNENNKIWIDPSSNGTEVLILTSGDLQQFKNAIIAENFDSTKVYNDGDYVIKDNNIYKITKTHNTNINWDSTSKQQTKISEEFKNLRKIKDSIAEQFSSTKTYTEGDCVFHNFKLYKFITTHNPGVWLDYHVEETTVSNILKELMGS